MATEIFLQPELEEIVIDPEKKSEWEVKIKELGLKGQIELTENSPKDSASPYTFINAQMQLVFSTLCPSKVAVEKYNKSVIPIDVLSHIALCKQEGYFKKLEIWFDEKSPDPIVVGYLSDSYSATLHLIARWGDEIIPYEQLVEKAIKRYTESLSIAAQKTKKECESILSNVELSVRQLFAGQVSEWHLRPSVQISF